MESDWQDLTLGEVIRLQRGHDLPTQDRRAGNVPILGSFGITGMHDKAKTKGPGLTIGRSGASIGVVAYSEVDFWPLNTALYVTDFLGNSPRFCFYWLKTLNLASFDSGSAQPSLNRNYVYHLPVRVPYRPEQESIAAILDALDKRINLLETTSATVESTAKSIFKSWFVDFDPVRAKAEGREPEGMDAATAALFPMEFEDSELRAIPKGWTVSGFDKAVTVTSGGTPKTARPDFWTGEIPWFSIADAPTPSQIFVIDTEKTITKAGLASCAAQLLPVGVTIITARGTVGKLAVTGVPLAINQSCYALAPKCLGSYGTYFQTGRLVDVLIQRAHGAVFSTITRETLSSVSIVLPPPDVGAKFEEEVSPLMERIRVGRETGKTLALLRDTLLPRLISGKLRVPQAEEMLEAVL